MSFKRWEISNQGTLTFSSNKTYMNYVHPACLKELEKKKKTAAPCPDRPFTLGSQKQFWADGIERVGP